MLAKKFLSFFLDFLINPLALGCAAFHDALLVYSYLRIKETKGYRNATDHKVNL